MKKKIGILTGGGDCPGMNAAIRAIVKTAATVYGMDVVGFKNGFRGLVFDDARKITYDDASNILTLGGTILGTSNKDNFFRIARNESQRVEPGKNRIKDALRTFKKHRLLGLICIGGDGTLTVANALHRQGIPIVGIPKTIDNDVLHTDQTFGFDTASTIATEAIDRLHSTAASHNRIMIVEVMGRSAGWIALHAGLAGGGDVILIPEIPYSLKTICGVIEKRFKRGRLYCLIVAAEGAYPRGSIPIWKKKAHGLSGISIKLANDIQNAMGIECRSTILGYLQRGGTPTPFDRVLATRYGNHALHLAARNQYGLMVCLQNNRIDSIPLARVAGVPRRIPLDSPLLQTALDVGTSFGEGKGSSRDMRHEMSHVAT
ncbi:MAG: 6-phosphofructokinase [Elusimicrobia bacterium]|nr:6-phosphofructokinase [Candidatus Obscuribacterium magneticum]